MAPIDLFDRLLSYYRKPDVKDQPVIQPATAALLSIAYVLIYILPFYLSSKTRPSPTLSRDAPSVIKARIRAVAFACVVTTAITTFVAVKHARLSPPEVLRILGIWPAEPLDVLQSTGLVVLLFLGPLYEAALAEGRWRAWMSGRAIRETFADTAGWRNYVAGPVSEELVFRAAILPLHLFSKEATTTLVFLTPLYFGIAHIHHFYEFKLSNPHTPLLPSLLRSVFQLTYTTVFGWLAAFLFLRTGSIYPPVLAHAFCNWMGLPRLWGRVEGPVTSIGPADGIHGKQSGVLGQPAQEQARRGLLWTLVYYVLLIAGAVLFFSNLWRLTESRHALVTFTTPSAAALKAPAQAAVKAASKAASQAIKPHKAPVKEGAWARWNVGGYGVGHVNF